MFHSAKGTTWDEHKYIKRIDGDYYYPDSYVGGRHLPSSSKNTKKDSKELSDADREESAISGLAKASGLLSEDVKYVFNTMKLYGTVAMEDIDVLAKKGNLNVTKSLADYINGVVNGSIKSTPEIKKALSQLTEGRSVSESQVKKFVENEKIDVKTFTHAMEKMYGDQTSTGSNKSKSKDNKVDPSELTKYEKDLIKSLRNQLSPTTDKKWDINEWDGNLTEGEIKLLKQINDAMGGKSDLAFLDSSKEEQSETPSEKDTNNLVSRSTGSTKVSEVSKKQIENGNAIIQKNLKNSVNSFGIGIDIYKKKKKGG